MACRRKTAVPIGLGRAVGDGRSEGRALRCSRGPFCERSSKAGRKSLSSRKPYFPTSSIFSDDSGRAAGLANGRTARVAGDCGDVRQVVLHETGHVVDASAADLVVAFARMAWYLEGGESRGPRPERRRLSLADMGGRVFCGVFFQAFRR